MPRVRAASLVSAPRDFFATFVLHLRKKSITLSLRTMKGTHLGEFEELVLLVTCLLYDEAYGVAVQEELARQAGRRVSISAVHSALHRLEAKGFLRSAMGGATPERGGRRKRLFVVTPAGREALRAARAVRERLWQLIPDLGLEGGAA